MHPEMNQEFYAALMESLLASQGCLFSSPDHKEPHSPIGVEKAYVGLTVHRANSFQSRPAGDPVDSDPKPALFTRSGSTLTGVGTDGLIPHEVPPSTKL